MEPYEFMLGERVRILTGEFQGQEGKIKMYGLDSGFKTLQYIVEIKHEGFPEPHYHHIKIEEKHLEKINEKS